MHAISASWSHSRRSAIAATIAAYRGGKANLSDVLGARRNEIDVRIQALQLAAETARWWAQINFLLPSDAHGSPPRAALERNIR
jgi:outer membrane protein TolC